MAKDTEDVRSERAFIVFRGGYFLYDLTIEIPVYQEEEKALYILCAAM
jgi:hypothetical protein